jgi:hypothetical protein
MLDIFCSLKWCWATCEDLKTYFCIWDAVFRNCAGTLYTSNSYYKTWSSDAYSSCCNCAQDLYVATWNAGITRIHKNYAIPIRPFKNEAVQPDDTWCKLL